MIFKEFHFILKEICEMFKQNDRTDLSLHDRIMSHFFLMIQKIENKQDFEVRINCLNASFSFQNPAEKLKPYSIIFTSGTLEPFDNFKVLKTDFEQFKCAHVINPKKQVFSRVLTLFWGNDI
jgi:hypothetical protein